MYPPVKFPCAVRRVRVHWKDGEWRIVKEVMIPQMTLPKSAELPETERQGVSGFWWEATDAEGRVLYRRSMPDPREPRMETVDRDGTFRNLGSGHRHEVVFDVLIPDLPEIQEVRFFASGEEGHGHGMAGTPDKRGPARLTATLKIRRSGEEGGGHGSR